MIKVYDADHTFLALLDPPKDLQITETLDTGYYNLYFQVPCNDTNLALFQEEFYVEMIDYAYIIKEIILDNNNFIKVYCQPNIEALSGHLIQVFDCLAKTPAQIYTYALTATGWTVNYKSTNNTTYTIQEPLLTAVEGVRKIAELAQQELFFDTKNKVLVVYDKMGVDLGAYYANELNLRLLTKQSNSYDYATVLYPYGKDGLTIATVNNNRVYLENYSYSSKYIEKVYINEDIEVPDLLLAEAQNYLDEIAVPRASYKLQLAKLGKSVGLGDKIMIVDKIKRIKQKQRVVKIVRYPFNPEKDTVEISNLQVNFAHTFLQNQKKMEQELKKIRDSLVEE